MYESATSHGVTFDGNSAPHIGWGLYPAATPQLIIQALGDIRNFRSSFHLLAWNIGALPVKMLGGQTDIRLGWVASCLFSFANQLPTKRGRHLNLPPSSSSEKEAPEQGALGRIIRSFPNSSMWKQRTPPSFARAPSHGAPPPSFLRALVGKSSTAQQGWH